MTRRPSPARPHAAAQAEVSGRPTRLTSGDSGRLPPALLELLDALGRAALRVLVPGAGAGCEAVAWAAAGHEVTAIDHAPTAIERCRERSRDVRVRLRTVCGDVLDLPRELAGAFDAVWEQTCFCALDPVHREVYARNMARVLRRGGRLFGLFWEHGRRSGPPWSVTEACVRALFAPYFVVEDYRLVRCLPGPEREFLGVLRRR